MLQPCTPTAGRPPAPKIKRAWPGIYLGWFWHNLFSPALTWGPVVWQYPLQSVYCQSSNHHPSCAPIVCTERGASPFGLESTCAPHSTTSLLCRFCAHQPEPLAGSPCPDGPDSSSHPTGFLIPTTTQHTSDVAIHDGRVHETLPLGLAIHVHQEKKNHHGPGMAWQGATRSQPVYNSCIQSRQPGQGQQAGLVEDRPTTRPPPLPHGLCVCANYSTRPLLLTTRVHLQSTAIVHVRPCQVPPPLHTSHGRPAVCSLTYSGSSNAAQPSRWWLSVNLELAT